MKVIIAISTYVLLIAGIYIYLQKNLSESNESIRLEQKVINENEEVNTSNKQQGSSIENVDYCSTCGAEITGVPYEAFARKYCDMRCYADDPDM
jgi:hypothetical protein